MADVSVLDALNHRPASNLLGPEDRRDALRLMLRIRRFETRAKELFLQGVIKGTAHSSVGQEAIAAGACPVLNDGDFLLTHHRGHGHTLAKGADPRRMFAELMGKASGYCGGLGGSMHIADFDSGILGANGIIGAGMGLGCARRWRSSWTRPAISGSPFSATGRPMRGSFTRR